MLKEGDIIELKDGHKVYVKRSLVFLSDQPGFGGHFVVTKTCMDGGGTGHGPHDVYPNGHHVFCEKLSDGTEVDFYESGSFTAVNVGIKPIGRAKRTWTDDTCKAKVEDSGVLSDIEHLLEQFPGYHLRISLDPNAIMIEAQGCEECGTESDMVFYSVCRPNRGEPFGKAVEDLKAKIKGATRG